MFENKKHADNENCQHSLLIIIATKFNIKKTKLQWRMTIPLLVGIVLILAMEEFFMKKIRAGCKDVWNAFMVRGAKWSPNDIPLCPTTAKVIPENVISFAEAKTLCNKHKKVGEMDFFVNVLEQSQAI